MRQTKKLAVAVTLALSTAGAFAAVATVNGVVIPDSRSDFFVKQVTERGQKDSPELRTRVKEELVRNEVLTQEAVRKGLDKSPDVQTRVDLARQQVLVGALVNEYVKANPVSEADLKKEYDRIKANMSGKEYKARHILVKDEAEAKAVLADLKKGKKFEDIAKAKSLDKGSAQNGGDLGWSNPNAFVPEFGSALKALQKGKLSEPVKTQFGYHIIKLDDVRDAKGPSYEEVKPELQRELQGQKVQKYVEELVGKAKVQ
ncbi:peptidylprolyl isomerase [Chitiniphilus shinanonensis]|uniref:peptidylprolyl isomerase n=1 Tax=Chitiniphilus shinanonensis TaxID=553088 RepID=A0ABQ6BP47_9NEIS|nr:peptidylprolyl isomerase [Chitiniphilus shinanonensis]GLS03229.1 peptidylprolyl isomerase [Chitiniphilus shinanonensis]